MRLQLNIDLEGDDRFELEKKLYDVIMDVAAFRVSELRDLVKEMQQEDEFMIQETRPNFNLELEI